MVQRMLRRYLFCVCSLMAFLLTPAAILRLHQEDIAATVANGAERLELLSRTMASRSAGCAAATGPAAILVANLKPQQAVSREKELSYAPTIHDVRDSYRRVDPDRKRDARPI
jgi:hypothetical protein